MLLDQNPSTSSSTRSLRVLCVDDNRDCANTTALWLRALGFHAQPCYDGNTALLMNEVYQPDVCLLDLNMPCMAGDELASLLLLKSTWRPRLVVALTGSADEIERARMRAAGAQVHLKKGGSLDELVRALERPLPGNN
ncbi:MAG: response regulator [Gemmataceae bacterium]